MAQISNPKIPKSFKDSTIEVEIQFPYHFKYDGNPLARTQSATDPDAHVWNDTVWVYCSQDHEKRTAEYYASMGGNPFSFSSAELFYESMDGYHVFSTVDMKNWTDHGEILHSRDVKWGIAGGGWMYAPGAAYKNGKYYLYFPHKDKKGEWRIGVAIGNRPQGPFTPNPNYIEGTSGIDPAILVDDDGQAYMYFDRVKVAKLKENMIEFAETPRNIVYGSSEVMSNGSTKSAEGPFMHKRNGIYYFSYTNLSNLFGAYYAMGTSPYGPFEFKGPLASWPPTGGQDHHSIIEFKGESYYFYHITFPGIPAVKKGHARIASFDRLYYNKDNTIQRIVHTTGPTKYLKTDATHGTITLEPAGGSYAIGTTVKVSLKCDLGYAFAGWSGDLSGNAKTTTIVVDNDKTISARFVPSPTYKLNATSTNGQVILNPEGGVYNQGDEVLLTPGKVFGYKFDSWSGDLSGSNVPEKLIMNGNKSVSAKHVSVPVYKLTSTATNGIIDFNPAGQDYEENTVVTMTAKPDYGYSFIGWKGAVKNTNKQVTITMNSNKKVTANFKHNGGGKIVFATNCGGTSFRSDEGVYYSADTNFFNGSTHAATAEIGETSDDALYQNNRYAKTLSYKIPLPNKSYKVTLMYAEIHHKAVGKRAFDVLIEGVKVASNLDVFAKVGRNIAYNETHTVTLTDGELNIEFAAIADNANISAIKIEE